ncbi:hypothetical protein F8M41_004377 [Gigaspora margarita]|uniref:Uncharacterized protein n=1 Tax=Gigaspora margarita TaxID=4874 RepID=A0A8H3X9T0_GIGMA|nr:hypothetical protein F8M41_004377 [Gigaspora margarita]
MENNSRIHHAFQKNANALQNHTLFLKYPIVQLLLQFNPRLIITLFAYFSFSCLTKPQGFTLTKKVSKLTKGAETDKRVTKLIKDKDNVIKNKLRKQKILKFYNRVNKCNIDFTRNVGCSQALVN